MYKAIGFILVAFILISAVFAETTTLQPCTDGTPYGQCSSVSPGYYCNSAGGTVQNVIGTYPDDYPDVSKRGKPTTLSKKCACSNFEGYIQKDGKCYNPNNPDSTTEDVQADEQTVNDTANQTRPAKTTQNKTTDEKKTVNSDNDPKKDNSIKIEKINTDDKKTDKAEKSAPDYTFILVVLGIGAISIGGLFFVAIIIAIIAFLFLRKSNKGLGK